MKWFLLLFLSSATIFLFHYALTGQAVYGDGIGYYAHLHSWVIDGDWDYTNEYKHLYDYQHNNALGPSQVSNVQIVLTNKNGKAQNFYGPGMAILLLPFYITAHKITIIINFFGGHLSAQGYGDWYQILSGLGAIFYIIIGLYLLEQIIKLFTHDKIVSRISAVTIFLATNLVYYGSFDVLNSHFASFFLITLFFYIFFKKDAPNHKDFFLGIVAGLLTINRPQDAAVILIWLFSSKRNVLSFPIGFILAIIPILIQWTQIFDSLFQHPYLQGLFYQFQNRESLDILGSLFHPINGFFTRTPLLFVLFIYFLYLLKKQKAKMFFYPFVFFVIQFLVITAQGGWNAAAYGGRMYISSLVFFGLLLGKLLQTIKKKGSLGVYLFVSIFIVINIFSIGRFLVVDKGIRDGKRGTEQRTLQRVVDLTNFFKRQIDLNFK